MTDSNGTPDWRTIKKNVLLALDAKSITKSIREIRKLASALDIHEVDETIDAVEQNYRSMRHFALKGADDPGRDLLLAKFFDTLYVAADTITLCHLAKSSATTYFSTTRRMASLSFASLVKEFADCDADQPKHYELLNDIFSFLWTSFPLSAADADLITKVIQYDQETAMVTVAALFLAQLEYYDPAKTRILADMYVNAEPEVAARALVAIVVTLSLYASTRTRTNSVAIILDSISDLSGRIARDLKKVYANLIHASDTERISRKLNDEILPDIMRMAPELRERMKNIDFDDISEITDNPEWLDMLDESGISDRLREISDIQEQGGDVMMGAFSKMKNFPFFFKPANWLLPFDARYFKPEILPESLAAAIEANPMLCDSDKWSMAFMMQHMPETQRMMVKSQLEQQTGQIEEDEKEKEDVSSALFKLDRRFDRSAAHFIQDLYRFFKLYDSRSEFKDIFRVNFFPYTIDKFAHELSLPETVRYFADLYMAAHNFSLAAKSFETLSNDDANVTDYQKCGFCHLKEGNIEHAIDLFNMADLLQSNNKWTIRQLAKCHERLGNYEEALKCYNRLSELEPENAKISWREAMCCEILQRYDDALQAYYKVLFYDENSVDARLGLASTLIAKNDYQKALRYANEAVEISKGKPALWQRGMIHMALGDIESAINDFREGFDGNDESLAEIRKRLISSFTDPTIATIIIDDILDKSN